MAGLQELPFIIKGVETVFGKETGETKKQAVHDLAMASISGVAMAYGVEGDTATAQTMAAFAPTIGNLTDNIVEAFNNNGTFQHSSGQQTSTQAQAVTAPPPGSSPGAGQPA